MNAKTCSQPVKLLHRDVYVCEWLGETGGKPVNVNLSGMQEYCPVFSTGGKVLAEDGESYLNVGILCVPANSSSLLSTNDPNRLATLTLLPPEPHILLPLLIRAAEVTSRTLKKMESKGMMDPGSITKVNVPLDDSWRSELKGYMFRIPPYYQYSLRRCLRSVLPASIHALLHTDPIETIPLLCFSKVCLQKIRNGEQHSKDSIDRLERQETSLKKRVQYDSTVPIGYGQFDPRSSVESYLASLRSLPPPPKAKISTGKAQALSSQSGADNRSANESEQKSPPSVLQILGDLPASCLMAYYESRRRWMFGGSGLTTRGLYVDGVNNNGTNSQHCKSASDRSDPCILSMAGVGVSMVNETSTSKMGNFRERLLFTRSPVVGYGFNDCAGISATTAADGSPMWSVDDDALPIAFFDPVTGEFQDSVQARMKSRLMVNFGNPYNEKRADSLIPEKYRSKAKRKFEADARSPHTPPSSPPHDAFDSVEEGEAIFVRKSPSRTPIRDDVNEDVSPPARKRVRSNSLDSTADKPVSAGSSGIKKREDVHGSSRPPPPAKPLPPAKSSRPPAPSPVITKQESPRPPKPVRGPPPPPAPTEASRKHTHAPKPPPRPTSTSAPPPPPIDARTVSKTVPVVENKNQTLTAEGLQRPDVKPNIALPAGWMCVWSKSQKRWYFFNTKNNKSVWEWPPPSGST